MLPRSLTAKAPMRRFSSTVMLPNSCRRSGTWTSPSRTIAAVDRRRTDLPARRISPAVTGTSPITVLSSVLLPAPFAPISATISPARTSSVDLVQHLRAAVSGDQALDLKQRVHRRRLRDRPR